MSQRLSGIYVIRIGPYYYYGKSNRMSRRVRSHFYGLCDGKHHNQKMLAVYKKYSNFSWEVYQYCDGQLMDACEAALISAASKDRMCMNLRLEDGSGSYVASGETRARMSEGQKKRMHSPGQKFSDQHLKRIGDALRGRKMSQEEIDKRTETSRLTWNRVKQLWSQDALAREAARAKRLAKARRGHRLTKQHRSRISASCSKAVEMRHEDGSVLVFDSMTHASKYLGCSSGSMSEYLQGKRAIPKKLRGWSGRYLHGGLDESMDRG